MVITFEFCVVFAALNPLSCTAYKNTNAVNQRAEMKIDVDGSGPLRPFPVTCEFYGEDHTQILLAFRFPLPVEALLYWCEDCSKLYTVRIRFRL
jgi:hypothetical protein